MFQTLGRGGEGRRGGGGRRKEREGRGMRAEGGGGGVREGGREGEGGMGGGGGRGAERRRPISELRVRRNSEIGLLEFVNCWLGGSWAPRGTWGPLS